MGGREYAEVDPRNTSQAYHGCHARNHPGTLEIYKCRVCGPATYGHVNAAIKTLVAGVAAGASPWATEPGVAPETNAQRLRARSYISPYSHTICLWPP